MADDDKTEEATPQRLEEAREQGDVPQSRELANFILFAGMALALYFYGESMVGRLMEVFRTYLSPHAILAESAGEYVALFAKLSQEILWIIGPFLAVVFVFGVAGYMSQFGILFTAQKLIPNFSKINPLAGFQRLFTTESFMEFVKATCKILIISIIAYLHFKDEFLQINEISAQPISRSFEYFIGVLADIFLAFLIFMAVVGVVDFAFQRWSYARRMKMSFQEVKDENKNREGNPQIKSRIRQIHRDRARKQMMEKVPHADVVVTNPTHVAVAIQYRRGEMKAPIVVAKGAGFLAIKIKELAARSQVPIVEKRELARYLYRHVEVGEMIPESLYTAVAEILAYVYKIKRKFQRALAAGV